MVKHLFYNKSAYSSLSPLFINISDYISQKYSFTPFRLYFAKSYYFNYTLSLNTSLYLYHNLPQSSLKPLPSPGALWTRFNYNRHITSPDIYSHTLLHSDRESYYTTHIPTHTTTHTHTTTTAMKMDDLTGS